MELPKRYLKNLRTRFLLNDGVSFERYTGKEGAKQFAKDIGDSLGMIEPIQAKYVIEHSYEEVFEELYHDVSIARKDWERAITEGMGDAHKKLQHELLNEPETTNDKKAFTEMER